MCESLQQQTAPVSNRDLQRKQGIAEQSPKRFESSVLLVKHLLLD